ncbi:sperm-specific protein PHI-2B/PHI-3-like [Zootoca vivipara]|uniref:sperm-specific protein PHI-2B/PHI-3-like n=1 Tax=Zootoca vivipara TaxID=8524 RepID=UPI00293C004C|nr:sperm-specific protein PHI-2B/PHI-3-like [Zootoca vivipara]
MGTAVLKGVVGRLHDAWQMRAPPLVSAAKSSPPLTSPVARPKTQNPPTLTMVMEAVKTLDEPKGVSVVAIKRYILGSYPGVDPIRLKYALKVALAKGLERGSLIRPRNSSALGATGRFKLGPEEAKEKKRQEKHSDSDGKTAPKPKKAAKNPKAKVPVEKPRQGAITEGEEEEAAPSKSIKAKASKHPGKPPTKPKAKKPPGGEKVAQISKKQSSSKALPANTPSAPQEAVSKESKTGGRGRGAPQAEAKAPTAAKKTKEAKGEKAKVDQESKPPRVKGGKKGEGKGREGENPASRGPKEA